MATSLRGIVGTLVLAVGLLIAAACTPAAQPTPGAAPAATKPAEAKATATTAAATPAAAKPAATALTAAKPAEASKPTAGADWKSEWDRMVAAAKKEGKVFVAGREGDAARRAASGFERAYPEITLVWTGVSGSTFAPKILAERNAGQYLWDVHTGGAMSPIQMLMPERVLDPLKPALILPEARDDSKWRGGLDNWWEDAERQHIFGFEAGVTSAIFVNREFVPKSELSNHDQLLEPKWKGKIISADLSRPGGAGARGAWFLKVKGEAWFRKFLDQVVVMEDERRVVESAVRGTHPIMVGVPAAVFAPFVKEGLTKNFEILDPGAEVAQWLTSGSSHVMLVNRAPNPNAAKVFINWLLTREGQQAYTDATGVASARLDVEGGDPLYSPKPGVQYARYYTIEMQKYTERSYAIAKEMLTR